MGARALEASLRLRLLALLLPLLLLVAAAALALTARAFDDVETDAARSRATVVLDMMRAELGEEDSDPRVELGEVLRAADHGVRIVVRARDAGLELRGADGVPEAMATLSRGACVTVEDGAGVPWRGCAVGEGGLSATVALPIAAEQATLRALALSIAGVLALAMLASVAAVRVAVRRPIASVAALAAWSSAVVASGERPPPAPAGDVVEVARLASAFDDLVARLFEALDRERANSAYVAHELRTPLTALKAELEALAGGGGDAGAAVARMLADVARLALVIDAILVLSAPPGARPSSRVVNVADVAREVAPRGAPVDAPDEALVEGDARLIELALQNLVDNATRHGGGVRGLRVERAAGGSAIEVTVIDDGPGLDEAARRRMFDRFWRAKNEGHATTESSPDRASPRAGTGLGLALVRAVAELHDGRAEARARDGGRGLAVSMTLGGLLAWHERA